MSLLAMSGCMEPVLIGETMKSERTTRTKSRETAMRIKTVITAILVNVLIARFAYNIRVCFYIGLHASECSVTLPLRSQRLGGYPMQIAIEYNKHCITIIM